MRLIRVLFYDGDEAAIRRGLEFRGVHGAYDAPSQRVTELVIEDREKVDTLARFLEAGYDFRPGEVPAEPHAAAEARRAALVGRTDAWRRWERYKVERVAGGTAAILGRTAYFTAAQDMAEYYRARHGGLILVTDLANADRGDLFQKPREEHDA